MRYVLLAMLLPLPLLAAEVKDADDRMVESCEFVGMIDVQGGQRIEKAREKGRKEAGELGATHVVWQPPAALSMGLMLSGRAYRCLTAP